MLFVTAVVTPVVSAQEEQKEVSLGLPQQIGNFYAWALGIGGLIALGVLIFGGILYAISAGNASRQDDAKAWITGSFIGLALLFGSWFILNTINPELTKLADLKLLTNKAAESLGQAGTSDSESEIIPGGAGFGNSPFLVTNVSVNVRSPGCGFTYKHPQTTFNLAQASCPVYPLAELFRYDQGGFCYGNRAHPGDVHHATDISAARGSPVYAVEDGRVISPFGFLAGSGGNRLWLQGNSGLKYYYAHMLSYAPGVTEGVGVKAGQLIGFVNATGNAVGTGDHLHFSVYPKDGDEVTGYNAIDPVILLNQVCKAVPGTAPTESPELAQILNKPQYSSFGVYLQEIGGQGASINLSQSFASASLYKLFVAQWLYEQREKGELNFSKKIPLVDVSSNISENQRDGIGNVDFFWKKLSGGPADRKLVSIQECLAPMIQWSDNVCGWSLRDWALKGGLDSYLNSQGYKNTSIDGLDTTAGDVASLLTKVAQGNMVNQSASQELYSLMLGQKHRYKIPRGAPNGAQVANKTGELHLTYHSHDAAIIKYNDKTYVLVVMTKGQSPDPAPTSVINQTISQLTTELFNALK